MAFTFKSVVSCASIALLFTVLFLFSEGASARRAGPFSTNKSVIDVDANRDDVAAFQEWKLVHGKKYESDEEDQERLRVWIENKAKIQKMMQETDPSYKLALDINEFTDMTNDEFDQTYNGLLVPEKDTSLLGQVHVEPLDMDILKDLPQEVDWRTKGVVSPVKNQGMCGSCWYVITIISQSIIFVLHFLIQKIIQ